MPANDDEMALSSTPRQVIAVLLALAFLETLDWHGATYLGIRSVLGIQTERGVRQAVRAARELGAVTVTHTPDGRGAKAVVRLTDRARSALIRAGVTPKGSPDA